MCSLSLKRDRQPTILLYFCFIDFHGVTIVILHISIDAHNPLQVASALAEVLNGKVYKFFTPGSFLVIPFMQPEAIEQMLGQPIQIASV